MKNLIGFAVVAGTLLSAPAMAWDGTPTGVIQSLDVTGGQNYAFRVALGGISSYCNGTSYDFAYLNETDSNYKVYVAVLTAAKFSGSSVTLYLTRESGASKIGYITVY